MIESLLSRLDKVRQRGHNQWMACCTAHEDHNPSLSIALLKDGRILIKCFAGCGAAEILGMIGMTMSDLFPDGCLGQYRSFATIEREKKDPLEHEKTILMIAEGQRKKGDRLTRDDLARERLAFERVRHGNPNGRY